MGHAKRLYIFCCCLVLGHAVQTPALSLPPPSPNEPEVTSSVESRWSRYVKDTQSVYTAVCGLKSQRKHWITTAIQCRKRLGKSRKDCFVNSSSFLQSLVLLMCFALSVVLSGVACSIYFFSIMPSLLPAMVPLCLLCGSMLPIQDTDVQSSDVSCTSGTSVHCVCGKAIITANQCTRQTVSVFHSECGAVIPMLLQRAGDVELNPGPQGRTANCQQSEQETQTQKEAGNSLKRRTEVSSEISEAQPSQLPSPQKPFESNVDGTKEDIETPLSLQEENSEVVAESLSEVTEKLLSNIPPSVLDDTSNAAFWSERQTSPRPVRKQSCDPSTSTYTISDGKIDFKMLLKEAIDAWRSKSHQEKEACYKRTDEVLIKLFVNLIRFYSEPQYAEIDNLKFCPMCLKEVKNVRNSHIIPKCLLNTFQLIHVPVKQFRQDQQDNNFLYNFSKWTRISPRRATWKLLCGQCEVNASVHEENLKKVYLSISSNPNKTCQIEDMEHKNLHHILAQILFRGVLVNVDIDSFSMGHWFFHEKFKTTFFRLWNYCREITYPSPPELFIFLLPNCAYNDETTYSLFSMERVLRSPHYTELVQDEAGLYFYTKIDCFHIVLPIDDDSLCYFKTFRNGLCTYGTTKTCLIQSVRFKKCQQCFSESKLVSYFPDVLMNWNVQLYIKYINMMLTQPKQFNIMDYDIPFILFSREKAGHNDTLSDIERRKCLKHELVDKAESLPDLSNAKNIVLKEQDNNEACKVSAHNSPLKVVMVSREEYKQLKEIETKVKEMANELPIQGETPEEMANELPIQGETPEERDVLLDRISDALLDYNKLRKKLDSELAAKRSSRKPDLEKLFRSYEDNFKCLAEKFSELEDPRYKDKITHDVWKKKDTMLAEVKEVMEQINGIDDDLYEKYYELSVKLQKLSISRSTM